MAALRAAGMQETTALTEEQWDKDAMQVLNMPPVWHFRFGAHVGHPRLIAAFERSPLLGIYIKRNYEDQLKSYIAFVRTIQGLRLGDDALEDELVMLREENEGWEGADGVITVWFEDLVKKRKENWHKVFVHLGFTPNYDKMFREMDGLYEANRAPSRLFYDRASV